MYVEKRKDGKNTKFYLVHSYREKGKVKKIRKYLGQNLTKSELKEEKARANRHIFELLEELSTQVFLFKLTRSQLGNLNRYSEKIKIVHFDDRKWQKFTEEFVFNTNAIEGSTVQRDEVPKILVKSRVENPDELETKGVAKGIEFIRKTKENFSIDLLSKLHKICFEKSKHFAGKIRNVEVAVVNSKGEVLHQGISVPDLVPALKDLESWYKLNKIKFRPLVLAAIMHNQFEYIHPFQDGNGRVGRLLLNFVLLKNNYPPININLEDRAEYYRTLQEYQKNRDLKPTIKFLIKQYKKTLKQGTTKNRKYENVGTP